MRTNGLMVKEDIVESELLNILLGKSIIDPIDSIDYNLEEFNYNLEFIYGFENENVKSKSYILLKTCENKPNNELHIVENIENFLNSIFSIKKTMYNDQLVFINQRKLAFNQKSSEIIQFLIEIYEEYKIVKSNLTKSNCPEFFQNEKMYLTNSMVKRFFHIMANRSFNIIINSKEYYNVNIYLENLPFELNFTMKYSNIILEDKNGFPLSLTDDNEYFFYNNNIYYPNKSQLKQYSPLNNIFKYSKDPFISFDNKDNEKVIFHVFQKLKNVFPSIGISEELKNNIYEEPLITQLYFDKENNDVIVDIKFIYGDLTVRPFSNEIRITDNKILIRDINKENEIINILKTFGFEPNEDYLILENSDNILSLLIDGLATLQEKSEIFYSEAFKKITIIDSSSYKAGIKLNDNDLLEFNFSIEGVDEDDYENMFRALKENKKYYRLKEGGFINLQDTKLMKINNFINNIDIQYSDLFENNVVLNKYNAMYIDETLSDDEMFYIEKNEAFQKLVSNIKNVTKAEYILPSHLESIMRSYQKTGFNWLKTLSTCGFGGVLADEMGLGKTLQAISFIESELENIRSKNLPVLIVAPSSLIYNWENEVLKFAPTVKTLVVAGSKKERDILLQEIQNTDMIITSYPLIRRDIESYKSINFSYFFIDEAQNIKNPNSQNSSCVKLIKANGYFAITGTPLENSLIELWSIFDFIMPGYMMSHSNFLKKYEIPIIKNNDKLILTDLIKHIQPFILRRFKKDVAIELPPKIEHKLVVEMTPDQKVAYLACLNLAKEDIDEEIKERGYNRSKLVILTALMRLRQICCDPSIFLKDYKGKSAKMLAIDELVEESIEQGHRILLYSQFTSVLKLIKERFNKNNIKYMYLDGQTKVTDRQQMVDDFNNGDSNVFLISLKAGGTGLNLTGADVVIHFDPWWNPSVEDQATDRAHRIGQEKTVEVIKLICKGTIEEKIYELQQKKKEIIKNVIDNHNEDQIISMMSQEEIMELFKV